MIWALYNRESFIRRVLTMIIKTNRLESAAEDKRYFSHVAQMADEKRSLLEESEALMNNLLNANVHLLIGELSSVQAKSIIPS